MSTSTILIDRRPEYLRRVQEPSLLLSALFSPRLIERLHQRLAPRHTHQFGILPCFDADDAYAREVARLFPDARLVADHSLGAFCESLEPSDRLIIIDTARLPVGLDALDGLLSGGAVGHARHLVHMDATGGSLLERVECGPEFQVRRIERLYRGVTHIEANGVSASSVPVSALRNMTSPGTCQLAELRASLSSSGVPSQDVVSSAPAWDLTQERHFVEFALRTLRSTVEQGPPAGLQERAPGIWIAPDAEVDPSARIYGPVVVHSAARIESDAALIGPVIVGPRALVGRRAVVNESVVSAAGRLDVGAVAVQCMVGAEAASPDGAPRRAAAVQWVATGDNPLYREALPDDPQDNPVVARGVSWKIKRGVDIAFAAIGLLALSPLLAVVAVLVKLTSRGPVFFAHDREGQGARVFRCWKFRTMIANADVQQRKLYAANAVDGPQFKMRRDPRVTWVGRILRATNIDELPQLYNVLRGEMSLIGPRPSPFRENQICVPWREARLSVRPGITGLWQVCRHDRASGDFHQWIHFDLLYVKHWSAWLDLRIFLATFYTLGGRWGVPVTWMIPALQRRRPARPSAPPRAAQPQRGAARSSVATAGGA